MAVIDLETLTKLSVDELFELSSQIMKQIEIKNYAVGYKDGFNDGVKSEKERQLLKRGDNND